MGLKGRCLKMSCAGSGSGSVVKSIYYSSREHGLVPSKHIE